MRQSPHLIYIHGFNSSPQSQKARLLGAEMAALSLQEHYHVPSLTFDPQHNIQVLTQLVERKLKQGVALVGSSMGGFYAAYLSQKFNIKAVLINPVVNAVELVNDHLGMLTNDYTGETYAMGPEDLVVYQQLQLSEVVAPENIMLLIQMADEVLNSQLAVDQYRDCRSVIEPGGSHGFDGFEKQIPAILDFAGIKFPER